MKHVRALVGVAVLLGACAGPRTAGHDAERVMQSRLAETAFSPAWTPPWRHDTERLHLEPLRPAVAELDYEAFMSSIPHLRETLQWGEWPSPEMQLEQNRVDLQRHWDELGAGEAYAYTVLVPDRSTCVGCLYVNPSDASPREAVVAFWVTEEGLAADLDQHLLQEVLAWFEREWPLDRAVFPISVTDPRGQELAERAGLVALPLGEGETRVPWVWTRAGAPQ